MPLSFWDPHLLPPRMIVCMGYAADTSTRLTKRTPQATSRQNAGKANLSCSIAENRKWPIQAKEGDRPVALAQASLPLPLLRHRVQTTHCYLRRKRDYLGPDVAQSARYHVCFSNQAWVSGNNEGGEDKTESRTSLGLGARLCNKIAAQCMLHTPSVNHRRPNVTHDDP